MKVPSVTPLHHCYLNWCRLHQCQDCFSSLMFQRSELVFLAESSLK